MTQPRNLNGQTFGYLTVVKRVENSKSGKARWLCKCNCGNTNVVSTCDLINGHTRSCGCRKFESHNKQHGLTKSDIHTKWLSMRQRCNDKNHKSYSRYGAKGITYDEQWDDFETFYLWSTNNGYSEGLSLDRIDNTKGYFPDNCRWVDWKSQCNNRRSNILIEYKGKTQSLKLWCEELGIKYSLVYGRMHKRKLSFEEAIK